MKSLNTGLATLGAVAMLCNPCQAFANQDSSCCGSKDHCGSKDYYCEEGGAYDECCSTPNYYAIGLGVLAAAGLAVAIVALTQSDDHH